MSKTVNLNTLPFIDVNSVTKNEGVDISPKQKNISSLPKTKNSKSGNPASESKLGEAKFDGKMRKFSLGQMLISQLNLAFIQDKAADTSVKTATAKPASQAKTVDAEKGVRGSYFVKAISKLAAGVEGLETKGNTAPNVSIDKNRYKFPAEGEYDVKSGILNKLTADKIGPLDRPSIYLGGRVGKTEIDAGLAFNPVVVRETSGGQTVPNSKIQTWTTDSSGSSPNNLYTVSRKGDEFVIKNVADGKEQSAVATASKLTVNNSDKSITLQGNDNKEYKLYPNYAFRPFYRISPDAENKAEAYKIDKPNSNGKRDGYADDYPNDIGTDNYMAIYPQQKFDMSFKIDKNNASLSISSENKTSSYGFKAGHRNEPWSLKRIDAIDQSGREKSDAEATKTKVSDGKWGEISLLQREKGGKLNKKPLTADLFNFEVSSELKAKFKEMTSIDGKGRFTSSDGSEEIYNDPSKVK